MFYHIGPSKNSHKVVESYTDDDASKMSPRNVYHYGYWTDRPIRRRKGSVSGKTYKNMLKNSFINFYD